MQQHFQQLHNEIVDTIVMQLNTRFESLKDVKLLNCNNFTNFKNNFPTNQIASLMQSYGQHFDKVKLKNELIFLYSSDVFINKSASEIIINNEIVQVFSKTNNQADLSLSIPSTTV